MMNNLNTAMIRIAVGRKEKGTIKEEGPVIAWEIGISKAKHYIFFHNICLFFCREIQHIDGLPNMSSFDKQILNAHIQTY